MKKVKQKSYSVFIVFLVFALIFTGLPRYANAAVGSMTITSANGVNVVGQTANLSVVYNLGDVVSLLGSITYTLPTGIKATTSDQINGRNLVASEITNNGQTVTITTAALLLLPSTTLTLNNKVLPAAGTYQFTGTSKNTLNVSIGSAMQQGAFTVLPAPTAPSGAQISVNNAVTGSSTVTVTGQTQGDTISVYNASNTLLGSGVVNAQGTATIAATLVPGGGSINVSTVRGTAESTKTAFAYSTAVLSAIPAANITVTNQYGDQDTIAVTGLSADDVITAYVSGTAIGNATANNSGAATITAKLTPGGGSVGVTLKRNTIESTPTTISYGAQVIPPVSSGNITVTNSYGGTSSVNVSGLTVGDIVTVSSGNTVLATSTAVTSTLSVPVVLTPTGGSLSVSIKQGLLQSAATTVNYSAITVPVIASANIQVNNRSGNTSDTVVVTGQLSGDTVNVYNADGLLGTGVIDAQGTVTIPVVLTPIGGSVNISLNHNGVESAPATVAYLAEVVAPLLSNQISLSSIVAGTATATISGLTNGDIVKVYGNGTVLGTATAGATGIVNIPLSLNPLGGSIGVGLTRNGIDSVTTSITYGSVVVPSIPVANVTVTNRSGNSDTVQVTGQTAGDIVTVYGNGSVIGTGTVNAQGTVALTVALVPLGGTIGVTITDQGVESVATTVTYGAEVTPAISANAVLITNNSGDNDIVQVSGLTSGDIIEVYGAGSVLGSATAQANGIATLDTTLLPMGGMVSVTLTRNGVESAPTVANYTTEVVAPLLQQNVSVLNDINGSSAVTVKSLQNGDIINVYANGTLIGIGSSDANGIATVSTDLAPNGGVLSVSLTRNTIESAAIQIGYAAILIPAIPSKDIGPQNNYGDNDTVTVDNLDEGQKVHVYSGSDLIGTGTVQANGSTVVNVTLIPTGGSVNVTAEYLGLESEPVSVNYPTEIVPPIPAASINVLNNVGNADSVTVSGVTVGNKVTISEGSAVLGTGTVASDGNVTVNLTLNPTGGTISATNTHSNIDSVPTPVVYLSEPAPVLLAADIQAINNVGNNDTIKVSNVQSGDMIWVLDANNTVLGTGLADSNGLVTIQLALLPEGGQVFVILSRNQVNSNIVNVAYAAEAVAPPANTPTAQVTQIQGVDGVITVIGMEVGEIAKVYDDDDQVLGTGIANADGQAIVNFKFLKAQGRLFVRVLVNGVETTVNTFDYQDIQVPVDPGTPIPTAVLSNISSDQGTINVANATAGDTVQVYSQDNQLLGTATIGSDGTAILTFTFPNGKGELSVRVTNNGTPTEISVIPYQDIEIPQPGTPTATLQNVTGDQGTVSVAGVTAGNVVKVYDADNNVLGTGVAGNDGTTQIVFTFPNAQGELSVRVTVNGTETEITTLPYSGIEIPTTPTPSAAITDIVGDQGTVNVTGATAGNVVKIYDADNNVLGTAVAGNDGTTQIVFTFPNAQGELSVRVIVNGTETEIVTLPYNGIEIPTTPTPSAAITNIVGDQGTVNVTGVTVGNVVKVYDADNNVLGTGVAGNDGTTQIVFTFPNTQGELSVRVTVNGTETEIATLPYSGIEVPTTPSPDAVLTDITGSRGTVNITGVTAGSTVTIYSATNEAIATGTADGSGQLTLMFSFPTAQGELSVRVTVNGLETEITTLPYSGIEIPTTPNLNATITNINGDQGTVNVTGATAGNVVKIYDADNNVLGTAVAGNDGTTQIVFTFPNAQGELSVRVTVNGTETEITTLPYSGIEIPTTPTPSAAITDIVGDQGTVNVTGATAGNIVKVYDADNNVLGTGVAGNDGTTQIVFTFPNAQGELSVRVTVNGTETEITTLPYSGIEIPATPTPSATITNIVDDQGTVNVTGVTANATVTIYSADNQVLGTGAANGTGEATVTFTFPGAQGELSVRVTVNGTETEITTLPYTNIQIPPPATTPSADLTNINGDQGTVNVAGVTAGSVVKVYDDNNNVLGTAVAGNGGTTQIVFTFPNAQGELSVRVTVNGTETEITTLPYSGIEIPTTPAPDAVLTDITGNQGTVSIVGVSAGDVVKVYDANNNVLGTGVAGSDGTAVITFTFPNTQGELSVRVTSNGTETEITTVPYNAIETPTTPTPEVVLTDINGDQGIITLDGLQAGDTVKVYDDSENVLSTAVANSSGQATLTFRFLKAQGKLLVRLAATNGTETLIRTIDYTNVEVPATPVPNAVLSDIVNAQGTVSVTGTTQGTTITIYNNANEVVATGTANANGEATIVFTFPSTQGELSVRVTTNGTETEIGKLPYSGIEIPATPTPTANLTDINGDQGTVTVSGVAVGNTISIYSDANEVLATGTANANGGATLTFTFPNAQGELSVRVTVNGTPTEIVKLPYSGIEIPTVPTPTANLTNINGDQGTVAVAGVTAGNAISIYSDTNQLLATGTADANGEIALNFTFLNVQGNLSIRVTVNGTETEIATIAYDGIQIPTEPTTPATPVVNLVDVQGNQGAIELSGFQVGDIITVQSDVYEQGTVQLGTITIGANGSGNINIQLPEAEGQLVITLNRNGTTSVIQTINYREGETPPPTTPTTPPTNPGTPPTNPETPSTNNNNEGSNRTPGVLGIPTPVTAASTDTPVPVVEEPTTPTDNSVEAASGDATDVELNDTPEVTLVQADKQNFSDVTGHWAEAEIDRLQDLSILNGVGGSQYDPNALITRAQFTQMINNLLQLPQNTSSTAYADVTTDKWHYNAVNAVSATGITNGYTDGSYQPNQQISREEMSHIINNTLSYLEPSTSFKVDTDQTLTPFKDGSDTSTWAKDGLATTVNQNIMQGRPNGQIAPKDNTTRAEAAVAISRLMDNMASHFNIKE